MTYAQARAENLDVYHFDAAVTRGEFADNMRANHRTVTEFEEVVAGFTLLCLAVSQRAEYGQIAKHVKTVRQFIGEQ